MQKEILQANDSQKLRLYVVWFSMLPTDARSRWGWTGGILEDSRVSHYWDEKKRVGRLFAGKDPESNDPDVVWDAFYVYGPDAQWTTKPEPLIVSGSTVLDDFDSLKSKLLPLLTDK
ncbi:MAG TPA: hypothetical protein VGP81_09150 [Pyrinomonadaceae bacterium]|nr:hypothetical protein [Pyrinomonadaceae bacterium]